MSPKEKYLYLLDTHLIQEKKEALKNIIDVAFQVITNQQDAERTSPADHDGFLLFQMNVLRGISIIEMTDGVNYTDHVTNSRLAVRDPFSVFTLVRSVFEAYCTWNNIYIQSKAKDELEFKYFLWVISGLKNRQKFSANLESSKKKKAEEALEIVDLLNRIRSTATYLSLSEGGKKNVEKLIEERNWQVVVDGERAHKLGWQALWSKAIPNGTALDDQYTALSLNAHPSNVAVFQFGAMYKQKREEINMSLAIELTQVILAAFIRDYCYYFPKTSNIFNGSIQVGQMLVNGYNLIYRGPEFVLNDLNERL